MKGGWSDAADRVLARSVFGTDDAAAAERAVLDWAAQQGFGRGRVEGIVLSVGAGATVSLPGGSRIFVKVWPGRMARDRLSAQMAVQGALAGHGFPAPGVLTEVSALGPGWAVAMAYNRAGMSTDVRVPGVRRAMAAGLAGFLAEAEAVRGVDGLPLMELPTDEAIWPEPHNALFDFPSTMRGAEWIDEIARTLLVTLRSAESRMVVGHCDWSGNNMRMGPHGIAVLYDWDSVFRDRETFIVGHAAAHFPVNWDLDVPEVPTPDEMHGFIHEYAAARGCAFTTAELEELSARATYSRAYKARCEHAIDPGGQRWPNSSRERLRTHGPYCFW